MSVNRLLDEPPWRIIRGRPILDAIPILPTRQQSRERCAAPRDAGTVCAKPAKDAASARCGQKGGGVGETGSKESRGSPEGSNARDCVWGSADACSERRVTIREGPGRTEVSMMAAKPPTCSTCGAVLSGYGWSPELKCMVSYCPRCNAKTETLRPAAGKPAVEMGVLDEAA